MLAEMRHYYNDPADAVAEAFRQYSLGQRVSVGREVGESRWHVRILGRIEAGEAGA